MKGTEYRGLIAKYLHANFARFGLVVYAEVPLGQTAERTEPRFDILMLRPQDQQALGFVCVYQESPGVIDERISRTLRALGSMWAPGVLVFGGDGSSADTLRRVDGSYSAVYADPAADGSRSQWTLELDQVVASVFGLWDQVIPPHLGVTAGRNTAMRVPQLSVAGVTKRSKKSGTAS